MPSSTFLNLPPEKRRTFLAAATAEFTRVPYTDASINQIIRTAGIPRGSFYMYFKDKEALFHYLIDEYVRRLERVVLTILNGCAGDLFATFLGVFDFVQQTARDSDGRKDFDDILRIASLNSTFLVTLFTQAAPSTVSGRLMERVDRSKLRLVSDEDLACTLRLLQAVSGPALRDAILSPDPDAARRRYAKALDMLAHGIYK